ncbi:DUF6074 family protein [Mesorhizobium sp. 1B3]|uniref:DUF6074 family protein n=1 Tax=Mesorhizobium sp. 1B3 TaxID=3243599 RepID=UPI003D95E424
MTFGHAVNDDQTAAQCVVIPFPAAKRVGKIRRTAEVLAEKTGRGADHYWKQVLAGMRSQMVAASLAEEVIEAELRAFADQVFGRIFLYG